MIAPVAGRRPATIKGYMNISSPPTTLDRFADTIRDTVDRIGVLRDRAPIIATARQDPRSQERRRPRTRRRDPAGYFGWPVFFPSAGLFVPAGGAAGAGCAGPAAPSFGSTILYS